METHVSSLPPDAKGESVELARMPYRAHGKDVTAYRIVIRDRDGNPIKGTPRIESVPEGALLIIDEQEA